MQIYAIHSNIVFMRIIWCMRAIFNRFIVLSRSNALQLEL
jgi:hypothetical protein